MRALNPRLVLCLVAAALVGVGAAVVAVASGLGVLVALFAYSGASSVSLFGLALATMPREPRAARPALLPAPGRHTVA